MNMELLSRMTGTPLVSLSYPVAKLKWKYGIFAWLNYRAFPMPVGAESPMSAFSE